MDQSEVKAFEELVVERMKLSAAMRKGAALRAHSFSAFFDGIKTCAMGAAFEGRFGRPPVHMHKCTGNDDYVRMMAEWPELSTTVALPDTGSACPTLSHPGSPVLLESAIYWMNNGRWTRERIADWLESLGL